MSRVEAGSVFLRAPPSIGVCDVLFMAVRGMCFGQRLAGCISSARQRAMPCRRIGVDGHLQGYALKRKEQEIVSDLVLVSQLTPTSTAVMFRGRRR